MLSEPRAITREDPPKPSEPRWRLHAEISPVRMLSQTSPTFVARSWNVGIPGAFSIGFGRMLGRYVMVGTRVGAEMAHRTSTSYFEDVSMHHRFVTASGWLQPYVELRPLPDRRVQPFGLVEGGLAIHGTRHHVDEPLAVWPRRSFTLDPLLGARVGLHAFVLPRLSIDADLGVRRFWDFTWQGSPAQRPSDAQDHELEVQLAATVGISGWW